VFLMLKGGVYIDTAVLWRLMNSRYCLEQHKSFDTRHPVVMICRRYISWKVNKVSVLCVSWSGLDMS
jgi:hypothetical protein